MANKKKQGRDEAYLAEAWANVLPEDGEGCPNRKTYRKHWGPDVPPSRVKGPPWFLLAATEDAGGAPTWAAHKGPSLNMDF